MQLSKLVLAIALSILLTACASSGGGYHSGDKSTIKTGTVESVRTVQLEGRSSIVGSLTGTILGSIAGASIGNSRTSGLNAFIGGILGSFAGSSAERSLTSEAGIEITVKLDNGEMIAITQDDDVQFQKGDQVKVIDSNRGATVTF